jgi:WhiB family transcriptional regulator, redox-sensing transcriptional regulator
LIPDIFLWKANDTALQAVEAGLRIRSHIIVRFQGKLFQRLTVETPVFGTQANCWGTDTNFFFPEPDGSHGSMVEPWLDDHGGVQKHNEYAIRICQGCPVLNACREYAIAAGESGVWGGTTEGGRRKLRQERHQMVAPVVALIETGLEHIADVGAA